MNAMLSHSGCALIALQQLLRLLEQRLDNLACIANHTERSLKPTSGMSKSSTEFIHERAVDCLLVKELEAADSLVKDSRQLFVKDHLGQLGLHNALIVC